MLLAFALTAAIALTVPGFVLAVRALPPVARRVELAIKPWACDICMCFWSTGLFAVLAAAYLHDPLYIAVAGPAYTIALVLLSHLERPPAAGFPEPPAMPPEGLAERLEPKEPS